MSSSEFLPTRAEFIPAILSDLVVRVALPLPLHIVRLPPVAGAIGSFRSVSPIEIRDSDVGYKTGDFGPTSQRRVEMPGLLHRERVPEQEYVECEVIYQPDRPVKAFADRQCQQAIHNNDPDPSLDHGLPPWKNSYEGFEEHQYRWVNMARTDMQHQANPPLWHHIDEPSYERPPFAPMPAHFRQPIEDAPPRKSLSRRNKNAMLRIPERRQGGNLQMPRGRKQVWTFKGSSTAPRPSRLFREGVGYEALVQGGIAMLDGDDRRRQVEEAVEEEAEENSIDWRMPVKRKIRSYSM